ncbi:MAG: oligosaccharide flippase family protein [Bacteroidales bacterium]|nr:oligosaccharide flippase family protein [Bacteroidales bacterium]
MKRKFTTNLLLLLSLNLLAKPFWIFGIDSTVQNLVGSSEYGVYFALFNFSILFNILLDFGLTNFNNREISRHANLLSRYLSNMVTVKFLMGILYAIVSVTFALIVGYSKAQLTLLAVLVFNQFLSSLILYLRSNISGLQRFKTDSLLSVTDRVLMIALCGFLLWGPFREHFSVQWFAYAQTIAYLITALIALLIVIRRAKFFKPRFDRAFIVSIVRQSYPYAILVLLMSFYYRIDSVMLERMLPDGDMQSGIYAQAFRLLDAASMLPFLFASLLLPLFSKMIKNNQDIKPLLGFAFRLLFVATFSLSVVCVVYRNQIMDLLYVNHSSESSVVLAIQMVSFLFISLVYIFGTLLTANGSLRHLNIISAFGVTLNIVLNLILIPRYTIIGAAVSSLVTQFSMAILQVLLSCKVFQVQLNLRSVLQFSGFIIIAIVVTFSILMESSNWAVGFIGTLAALSILSILMRIVRIKEIVKLLIGFEE